jgi:poly-gamma-glutamate synthesis protein (capsule biosynthesis protein)
VVELTGNHVNDWGTAALSRTIDLYDASGIVYFGGGRNAEDARQGRIVTHNGNRIAFIGCNPVGPPGAWAGPDRPGAARCDDTFLAEAIPRLRQMADVVIMTIQYQEYYQYTVPAAQRDFFGRYARLGAHVVMGSQAHQPQGFGFVDGAFIHYGIGNLFFDQMSAIGTRQMFADVLYIYEGRHISTGLFTGINEDFARVRPMSPAERADFLRTLFRASGW